MTPQTSQQIDLTTVDGFNLLSADSQAKILASSQLLHFGPGQPLTSCDLIPCRILILISGQARLMCRDHGSLLTLKKLGKGDIIGLASLLRADPCEETSASTELIALAISDELVVELLENNPAFRAWCLSSLFPAELQALLNHLIALCPRGDISSTQLSQSVDARVCVPSAGEIPDISYRWFVGSDNCEDQPIYSPIAAGQAQSLRSRSKFPVRVVGIAEKDLKNWCVSDEGTRKHADLVKSISSEQLLPDQQALEPGELALATSLDLGQYAERGFQLIRAEGAIHETLACFQMLTAELKLPFRKDSIEKILRDSLRRGQEPDLQLCGNLAAMLGLHVTGAHVPAAMGVRLQIPSLVRWKSSFALVHRSHSRGLILASPSDGFVELSPSDLEIYYPHGIELLLLDRTATTPEQKFGPSWFWPALQRYRGMLLQVLVASFVVQLFSLANPLLIQVIIDKVITQRSLDTLQVLGLALVVVTLLEGVLGSLRTFLFTETTNRIDSRLGAEIIDHLLRLPLNYFDKRPVGELGTRIAELEKIRNFLTGQALTTVLDAAFSLIYIVVMVFYSWILTLIALFVVPIQIVLTILGAPLFRRQYRQAAQENARTQSHLVEVLTGIQTVKAQNVEMVSRWKWQDLYSGYITRTFEKTITGTALTETSQVLQKLSQLLVLWVGATLVLKGELTLGQLIAFRIISGYVTQPLLRLSSIWQNIQELRVSFERLADVVDTPEESNETDKKKIPLPPIHGDVVFEDLNFTFTTGRPPILKDVNLTIKAGTFVGIVGQSGSGKSTLMKLLPRLYSPQSGRILIDNYDIDKVELYSLRRQIGIVPQDPLLFSGSISENIALTDPDAASDQIVDAAKIACAHDFIMQLPSGYSSDVGERGAGLSGGQRQRIAIARTLLSKPKLLVMDEATSALDYETERQVCDNLHENLIDCTVFFITHRLSTIRRADIIVMMHQGAIVEIGTHNELMDMRGRYYALYRQQESV
jgi:ATP-binding cassette, subfamily B, bacterial HlyB/CyaB